MKLKKLAGIGMLVAALGVSTGCGNKEAQINENETAVVKWYLPTVMEGKDKNEVIDKVNQMMEERYGIKLDLVMIDAGNYSSKMQVINAGREKYDLAFTCNWPNDYYTNVANNPLLDITDILPKYAPKTWEATDSNVRAATRVGGHI